jgi:hypothetical protein
MTSDLPARQLLRYGRRSHQPKFIFGFYDQCPDGVLIGCPIVTAIPRLR